ncbi:MAG TPA: cytochrome P450 [Amycolatopsis sp.]|uniref:cytochrome P450 n=1 Tax=Amycolatopsis sp. TaxID=37632 RepID=UPI002B4999BC|nr:cytochrome P450 [Amycolatopsis sp.]HKS46534.1 cytochrome P450 [Amycolatopsis sp.]
MNRSEFQLAFRTLPFLDGHADDPAGFLELRPGRVLVWDPGAIDGIFRADQRLRHPGSRSFKPLLGPRSLLWQEGSRHADYRRVLGGPLRGRQLSGYRNLISQATDAAIDALPIGAEFSVADWTRGLALRVMARIVFGRAGDDVIVPFGQWMHRALGSRARTLAYRYLRGGLPQPDAELKELLVHRARVAARKDATTLAGRLLASDRFSDLHDGELRDQLVSLLFAGHETTASTAAWTLFWLDRHEKVRVGVLAELAATTDDGSNVDKVPLLQAVVSETLRLTPPVPAAGNRVLTEACAFGGREFPAGTVLTPSIYLAHRRPGPFPDPRRFDSGRFLGQRVPSHDYFPFGGGIRHCLGSRLGQLEVRMIVAALMRRRELRCVNPRAGVPQLRGHAMAPSAKLKMKVVPCRG